MNFLKFKDIYRRKLLYMELEIPIIYKEHLLESFDYYHFKNGSICFDFKVIFKMLELIKLNELIISLRKSFRCFIKYLYYSNIEALISISNIESILTHNDQHNLFQYLSKKIIHTKFYTIQNDYHGHLTRWNLYNKKNTKYFTYKYLFVPGIEAVEELKKHGHIIEKYFIAGSLKGSYFWEIIQLLIVKVNMISALYQSGKHT